ncbi:hypothetical protein DUI87_31224 [Hirundo rustica rustica]|uniref:Uncharacterized protein n=1 Tax=Hirundo rustica rustica TaxID=333673 RepID=A0A3M0IWR3_HIRRU|nr:hypothetical protein DUI87_31224 [Hirundo rustica rustica]
MGSTTILILAVLGIFLSLKLKHQVDASTATEVQERGEYLHREMTRLLQEIEGSSGIMETLLYCAWQQQRLLWVTAAALALVLLAMGCWLLKGRKHQEPSQLFILFWPPRRHL